MKLSIIIEARLENWGIDVPLEDYIPQAIMIFMHRYDWDDHRRYIVADFKELIGAAHATEFHSGKCKACRRLSTIWSNLSAESKFYLSRNMMRFWTNFAKMVSQEYKFSELGAHSKWWKIRNFIYCLDSKQNLKNSSVSNTFKSLAEELYLDKRAHLEKCVILLQMFTCGDDLYDENIKNYRVNVKGASRKFLIDNTSYRILTLSVMFKF